VPRRRTPRRPGLRIHRRKRLEPRDLTRRHGIPATTPARTLLDLAARLPSRRLERAVNEADKLDLIDPESLRADLASRRHERGLPALRRLLDDRTFVLTDSELERRFLPIARWAGLPSPGPASASVDTGWTSTGRSWASWSRPTGSDTTAHRHNRRTTAGATRC
jgi:hypothetical protein